MYVEGVNRKSRKLFSFQLLSFDDNEMRLVSRSLRRRNQASLMGRSVPVVSCQQHRLLKQHPEHTHTHTHTHTRGED